jgi:hypothetical protein
MFEKKKKKKKYIYIYIPLTVVLISKVGGPQISSLDRMPQIFGSK